MPFCGAVGSDTMPAAGIFGLSGAAEGESVLVGGAAGLEDITEADANPGGAGFPGVPGITGCPGKDRGVGVHEVSGRKLGSEGGGIVDIEV